MFMIALFSLLLRAQAGHLTVSAPRITYTLTWSENSFFYKSPQAELSMRQRACNEHILKGLNLQLRSWERGTIKHMPRADVTYTINGKKQKVTQRSKFGRGLAAIPVEIERMKREEKIICKDAQ